MKYTIEDIRNSLIKQEIKSSNLIEDIYKNLKKWKYLNAFVTITEKEAIKKAKELDNKKIELNNLLFSIPYVAKDNFATKNILTTACSNILSNYIPPYDAFIINELKEKNTILLGKSTLDELGMGGTGLTANIGKVYNPWNKEHIIGGSSSGSAALVATGIVPFALGTDTGDSIRKPASYSGIVGLKPTYGLISRQGVLPYAPSFDTVGFFTRNVKDSTICFDSLVKKDPNDFTSQKAQKFSCYENITSDIKNYRIAYIKEIHNQLSSDLKKKYDKLFYNLRKKGVIVEAINFSKDLLKSLLPVYYIISCTEAISSQSNLTGISFGKRQKGKNWKESVINSRTKGLGHIIKSRYIIGEYSSSSDNQNELFFHSKKIRRLISDKVYQIFKLYDGLIIPPASSDAPKINEVNEKSIFIDNKNFVDNSLLLANFSGIPSITIPFTFSNNNLPIGINICSNIFSEQKMFNIAYAIEKIVKLKNLKPKKDN